MIIGLKPVAFTTRADLARVRLTPFIDNVFLAGYKILRCSLATQADR